MTLREQPQDIHDKEPNSNPETVEYNPMLKKRFPKGDNFAECRLCSWVQSNENKKCERCGCVELRPVSKRTALYPPSKGSVAHLSRQMGMCWNEQTNEETGESIRHQVVEGVKLVVKLEYGEAHQEHYCVTCGAAYSWTDGRLATSQELEDARAGKIPRPTRGMLVMGRGE